MKNENNKKRSETKEVKLVCDAAPLFCALFVTASMLGFCMVPYAVRPPFIYIFAGCCPCLPRRSSSFWPTSFGRFLPVIFVPSSSLPSFSCLVLSPQIGSATAR